MGEQVIPPEGRQGGRVRPSTGRGLGRFGPAGALGMLLVPLLLLAMVSSPALLGQSPPSLKEQKEKLEQTAKEEQSILDALEAIDRSVLEQEQKLDALRERQQSVDARIGGLESERVRLEQGLAERRVQLQKRLRALYKYSNKGFFQALLAGGSGTEILQRMKYLQLIIRKDMELIEAQRTSLERFSDVKRELETERIQVKELAKQVEAQVTVAQTERARKQELLKRIRAEKGIEERRLRELEAAAEALARKVAAIPPPKPTPTPAPVASAASEPASPLRQKAVEGEQARFADQISRLPFPVPGGKVTRAFGRYKVEGMKAWETHRGLDIVAPMGADIKAIYQGEVKLAEWFKGYGLLLILDHGEGYHSIYAHASKLLKKIGDKVKTGEKIGLVGDTGSFQGPYLYLEVREQGKPVNPIQWVRVPADAMQLE